MSQSLNTQEKNILLTKQGELRICYQRSICSLTVDNKSLLFKSNRHRDRVVEILSLFNYKHSVRKKSIHGVSSRAIERINNLLLIWN